MDQLKRVLHVTKAYWPHLGGVETVVRQLAEGAAGMGWEVKVLCLGEENQSICIDGVIVHRVKTSISLGNAPLSLRFLAEYNRLKDWAEVIHFQVPNPIGEIAFLFLGKGAAKTAVCTYQSDPLRPRWAVPFYRPILHAFVRKCDKVVATSPAYVRTSPILSSIFDKVKIIPLGVNPSRFEEVAKKEMETMKSKLVDLHSPVGLFVGRLVYYKGVDVLIRAMSNVPELSLIILGEGPLKRDLMELVRELDLQKRIQFLSFLSPEEYPTIFSCVDFLVLPSVERTEAFGLVCLEAMAAGLPVITTELGTGTSFYNQNGVTGLVVPPRSIERLVKALRLLASDSKLRKIMGGRAKEQVQQFTVGRMVESYLKVYENGEYK